MITKIDQQTGEIIVLTDSEIKAEIMQLQGFTDNKQYQKEYDKLRNRVRNYQTLTGSRKNLRVNEIMLRIARRTSQGQKLTPEQEAITKTTSAGTAAFRRQFELNKVSQRQQAIARSGVLGAFSGLIEKSPTTRNNLNNWLDEVIGTEIAKDDKGRTIYDDDGDVVTIEVLRSARVTAKELQDFLALQAKDLHRRQKAEMSSNRRFYEGHSMKPGTD